MFNKTFRLRLPYILIYTLLNVQNNLRFEGFQIIDFKCNMYKSQISSCKMSFFEKKKPEASASARYFFGVEPGDDGSIFACTRRLDLMGTTFSIWDKLAKKYDSLWVQKYSLTPTRRRVLALLKNCKHDFSMLDVGCATGQLLNEVRSEFAGSKLYGIDKSQSMIELARARNIDAKFDCVYAEEYDAAIRFDVITCCHSFPYYQDKELVLQKIASLLEDRGMAIFIQGSINSVYDKVIMSFVELTAEKANYLSRKDFVALAEACFVVEEIFSIREKWFMPSLCGFVLRKKA